jgi:hypothetical protein
LISVFLLGTVALTEGNRLDRRLALRSDSEGEFSEGREEPLPWIGIKTEFVVVAAEVLDEGVPSADYLCSAEPFDTTHRSQPSLQSAVIVFDGVARVLLHHMTGGGQQLIEHPQIGRRLVGRHLRRTGGALKHPGEEPVRGQQITLVGGEDVDDLAELVDRPVQVDPPAGNLDEVSSTNHRSPGACRQGRAHL